ncbi:MAG: zinc-ribbon family protein [Podoviridae sp. cty5g4]|nr:MAG: zinc-ribbon family protein [Podoviridae sp. cty5g4]
MILIKMLESVGAKDYALWRCGRCGRSIRAGFKVGRNMRACYQCQQRERERESISATFRHKDISPAIRECLSCGLGFESEGKWNRRCPTCLEKADYIETENNFKRAKSDALMKTLGDRAVSDEELVRGILY